MMFKQAIMALGLAMSIGATAAPAQVIGGEVDIEGSRHDVIFLGGEIRVRGEIDGDVSALAGEGDIDADIRGALHFLGGDIRVRGRVGEEVEIAGGDVDLHADVGGDVSVAGGDVNVGGSIGEDLSAAGGSVEIDADVRGRAHAAGGEVRFTANSRVAGGAEIAGGEVELAGHIIGDVRIEGAEITLAGIIDGDVEIEAEEVYILNNAQVTGVLEIRGPNQPVVAEGASIGSYDYAYAPFNFGAKHWDDIDIEFDGPWEAIGAPFEFFGFAVPGSALLLGLLAILLTPRGVSRVARTFRSKPVMSGFVGFIGFALSPIVLIVLTVLLAITVIGIVLIPFMWVLFWPFLLVCLALGALSVGDLIFNRSPDQPLGLGMRLLSMLLVLAVSAALGVVGVLGALAGFALMFIGLGAWLMSGGEAKRQAYAAAHAGQHDNAVTQG